MCLSLKNFEQDDFNFGSRYYLINFHKKFTKERVKLHESCFPSTVPRRLERFLDSKRFYYKLSFLLFDGDWDDLIGASDVQKIFNVFVLSNVAIAKKHRGKDLGYGMVCNSLITANRLGIDRVYLIVNPNNLVAVNLYKKFGFEFL